MRLKIRSAQIAMLECCRTHTILLRKRECNTRFSNVELVLVLTYWLNHSDIISLTIAIQTSICIYHVVLIPSIKGKGGWILERSCAA